MTLKEIVRAAAVSNRTHGMKVVIGDDCFVVTDIVKPAGQNRLELSYCTVEHEEDEDDTLSLDELVIRIDKKHHDLEVVACCDDMSENNGSESSITNVMTDEDRNLLKLVI